MMFCENCGNPDMMYLDEGRYHCQECLYIVESFDSQFIQKKKKNRYKRITYFMLYMKRIQVKIEPSDKTVLNKLEEKDINDVTSIKRYLKKNKLKAHYKYISYYYKHLNNTHFDILTSDETNQLKKIFSDVVDAYNKLFRKCRYFMCYPYIAKKLLQYMGKDELAKAVPLVISKNSLEKNNDKWYKITQIVDIPYQL